MSGTFSGLQNNVLYLCLSNLDMSGHLIRTSGDCPVHFHLLQDNCPVPLFMDICYWPCLLYETYNLGSSRSHVTGLLIKTNHSSLLLIKCIFDQMLLFCKAWVLSQYLTCLFCFLQDPDTNVVLLRNVCFWIDSNGASALNACFEAATPSILPINFAHLLISIITNVSLIFITLCVLLWPSGPNSVLYS